MTRGASEILLYGSVGESFWGEESFTHKDVRAQLSGLSGPLTVRINSGGGIATDGQAIYSALRGYDGAVHVVVEGVAASAASLIAMAGDTITMTAGSLLMIHDPASWYVDGRGTEDDHRHAADSLQVIATAYAGIYAKRAGISVEAARAIMKAETYYDGPAAISAGFATAVDEGAEEFAPAAFDYRMYRHAPKGLLSVTGALKRQRPRAKVLAIMARANGRAAASPKATDRSSHMLDKTPPAKLQAKITAALRAKGKKKLAADLEDFHPLMVEGAAPDALADLISRIDDLLEATGLVSERAAIIQQIAIELVGSDEEVEDLEEEEIEARTRGRAMLMQNALSVAVRVVSDMNARDVPATASIRPGAPTRITRDEGTTMRQGITGALVARFIAAREVQGPARQYMGQSVAEMAATAIGHRGPVRTAGDRLRVIDMALGSHSTSDFPAIFENALNKGLLASYTAAPRSYQEVSQRRDFRDFRPHSVAGVGDFPMLERVGETGEIKAGTVSESKEVMQLLPYAKQFRISRQMLVDDDLGAVERILSDRGRSVASFEDKTFYDMMLSGSNADGPTLQETGRQVFNTTDETKAGTAGALAVDTLGAAWAKLRKRKSLDGNDLELVPAVLLVGPDREMLAMQVLAEINATEAGKVNPYSGKLHLVVTAKITGNAWYVFADPELAPCFAYGYLEGQEGPRMRMDEPFGQQGMAWSVELDFGVGAIGWRGGFKNAGA